MFHLLTHAFFKALLFLGAGSVIHGCHEEQDIRRMGGLRKFMPVTFATYAVCMMALSGVPLFFSGFWSKDEILHSASIWSVSRWSFVLLATATLLTAFYMTRQVCYVFFGPYRGAAHPPMPFESPIAVDESSLSPGERAGVPGTAATAQSDTHQEVLASAGSPSPPQEERAGERRPFHPRESPL